MFEVELIVDAPTGFSNEEREHWARTQRYLIEQGTFQESDADTLRRYVKISSFADSLWAAVNEPIVEGSKKQPVAHPLIKAAMEAETKAHGYAEALLLTPLARSQRKIDGKKGQNELQELLSD